jgi:HAD superfamily hydrolase (TIGR01509 family)
VRRFDAVLFDAGNTLVYLDHARVAEIAGGDVQEGDLWRGERLARQDADHLAASGQGHLARWGRYMAVMLETAGLTGEARDDAVDRLLTEHMRANLWSRVPASVAPTLRRLKEAGYVLGVISNAEGTVAELLADAGLKPFFRFIIDSHLVGVEKPDPRIFALGLERAGTTPERTLFIGDAYGIDVAGARGAGLEAVLLDSFGIYEHVDCARIEALAELVSMVEAG